MIFFFQYLLSLQINDTTVPSRARQTLPEHLEIIRMADSSINIITKQIFQRGSTFGPFLAKRNWALNPVTLFPIRIFGNTSSETYYLDYSDEYTSNWMCFIQPASCAKEQNLICYQVKQDIFYTAMRLITAGEQLRVWYAPYYALKMEMPLYDVNLTNIGQLTSESLESATNLSTIKDQVEILNKDVARNLAERLPAQQLGARGNKENWTCRICSSVIDSVVAYAKHLMEHYKPLSGAYCNICNKKFHNWSVMMRHKSHKHPELNSKNDTIGIPTSANQQEQNKQISLNVHDSEGDTSDAMKNILEKFKTEHTITDKDNQHTLLDTNTINVSNLLQNSENLIENSSLKLILENQCLNINLSSMADSLLSENLSGSDIKFNVEELSSDLLDMTPEVDNNINRQIDNLVCDICEKKFVKPEYLYRHLRKHTGEFICPLCLGVFARKENLLSHVCSSQETQDHLECPYCQKQFAVKKYLKRHMLKHMMLSSCKWCCHVFTTTTDINEHKCTAPNHVCGQCGKKFAQRTHLNRHIKLHNEPKRTVKKIIKETKEDKPVICEKCGEIFKTPSILKQHLRSHGERTYECDICQRKFHRIGVLNEHKNIHQNVQIPCNYCGKKLKSKKALDVHVLLHGNKKFQCDKCDKSFFQRCNYLKHYKQIHGDVKIYKCSHCPTQFKSEISLTKHIEKHTKPAEYSCNLCYKSFHFPNQLKRHMQTSHSGIIYRCPFCDMTARHRHSMRRHFERQHKTLRDDWDKPGFVNQLIEKTPIENTNIPYNVNETNVNDNNQIILSVEEVEEAFANNQTNSIVEIDPTVLNNQNLLLQVSQENSELPLNEVPQLTISDADSTLAESVLGNTYIFGEGDGDIMFYVLETAPAISEY